MVKTQFLNNVHLENEMSYPVGRYLSSNLEQINHMAEAIYSALGTYEDLKVVNLICRGSSGAIISAIVLQYLATKDVDAKITHIKKEGESSHSSAVRYDRDEVNVILDDFISSGETMRSIYEALQREFCDGGEPPIDILAVTGVADVGQVGFKPKTVISGTGYL